MKTFQKTLLSFGLACLMGACTSSKQEATQGLVTVHVDVDNIRTDVNLSEFAESKIVPLPTSDELLIGNSISI